MKNEALRVNRVDNPPSIKVLLDKYSVETREYARDRSRKIAWCSSTGPVELLRAMDFDVYFPEKLWNTFGSVETASDLKPVSDQKQTFQRSPAFLKADRMAKKITCSRDHLFRNRWKMDIPEPDLLVFNTVQGKRAKKWLDGYSRTLEKPVIGLYAPSVKGEISGTVVKAVVLQLRKMILTLEAISGRNFDMDRLREVVSLSKKCADLWKSCLQTAAFLPSPWPFFEQLSCMLPAVVLRGTLVAEEFYQRLFSELARRVGQGIVAVENEQNRLLWDGPPLLTGHDKLNTFLKSMNTCIVASTFCNTWDFCALDETQPLTSMAKAYAGLYAARDAGHQCAVIQKLKKEFRVNGILFNNTDIDAHVSPNSDEILARLTGARHVPTLRINQDFYHSENHDKQIRMTEIACFIEQLRYKND
ncbi:2-hydroxyacyl-CoA dehydratase family protein [bacterium]|nr:2-hydroxyacyl-CoA dehydratase family protein [bacterium]